MIIEKVILFNLTTRSWMLHYSSQFANALKDKFKVYAVVASYYKLDFYEKDVWLLKIRTNPNLVSFIFDSLMFWNHLILIYKIFKIKPDVIHFMDNHPWYLFYWKLFKLLWYTIYVTQHNPIQHSWENKWIQWKVEYMVNTLFRKISDKIIVNGDILKEDLIKVYNVSKEKIISIPHWDYTFLKKWAKWFKPLKNCFIFFGRIKDYKWLDVLFESLDFVISKVSDFKLIIAWNWSLDKYINQINKYKENISIYNFEIKDEEIHKYFEMSEFTVLPYKDATASWVVQVSYCFSKAVIVTNVWELPTVVDQWKTWFIVPANDSKTLWDRIVWMLENKETVIEMGNNWYKYTIEKFWWKNIVEKIYF